jgi:hypothetical protein
MPKKTLAAATAFYRLAGGHKLTVDLGLYNIDRLREMKYNITRPH